MRLMGTSRADDDDYVEATARYFRLSMSPGGAVENNAI